MTDLQDAIAFAQDAEAAFPRSMYLPDGRFVMTADSGEGPPDNEVLGPVTPRGGQAGVIYRYGSLLAEWGDAGRADMTFSVAKSFLSLLTGLALGDGLIKSLDDKVAGYVGRRLESPEPRHHLAPPADPDQRMGGHGVRQGRPHRPQPRGRAAVADAPKGTRRAMKKPGSFYEYNDVRVNRLSSACCSSSRAAAGGAEAPHHGPDRRLDGWRWDGYRNSTVTIDGKPMISVSGGGHWGGGIVI